MRLEFVVIAALLIGLWILVATLGLQASLGDATALLRQPGRLFRSLASMLVIMPVVAATLARSFDLAPAVKIALVALALSPVPPFLPPRNIKAGSDPAYAIGLLVATSLISIVQVPLTLALLAPVFDLPLALPFSRVLVPIGLTVLGPLLVGLLVKRLAPRFSARAAGPASRLAVLLLVAGLIPLMVTSLAKAMPLIGDGTLLAMVVFCLIGLAVGHLLGGPVPGDRATLALSTAARHPGVAMAIARANFPDQTLVFPAVLLYILLSAIVSLPYTAWAARRTARRLPSTTP